MSFPTFQRFEANGLKTAIVRHRPRHPIIARAADRLTRWLGEPGMAHLGFHRLGSEFATRKIASIREQLQRGETVYIAGLAAPGTHNTGIALIEVTR
jgi:carbamoyltransferase